MRNGAGKTRNVILVLAAFLAALFILPFWAVAEEGGSGHYAPGAAASFFDAFPPKPGLALFGFYTHYAGSAEGDLEIPNVGLITIGLEATSNVATVGAFYRIKATVLGGGLAFGAVVPFIWLDVKATVDSPLGPVEKKDNASGIGDIMVYPFMLGWTGAGGDLRYDVRLGVYAPTGSYEVKKLASLGKNYWSFEPGFMASYLGSKNGFEASAYTAFDFNTKNPDTDYLTGIQFHIDATLAQHFPLFGGFAGLGANGFYYQQITDDSGEGAPSMEFKGRTVGVGPVVSYMRAVGKNNLVVELKWLPELNVEKRLEGDYIYLKAAWSF